MADWCDRADWQESRWQSSWHTKSQQKAEPANLQRLIGKWADVSGSVYEVSKNGDRLDVRTFRPAGDPWSSRNERGGLFTQGLIRMERGWIVWGKAQPKFYLDLASTLTTLRGENRTVVWEPWATNCKKQFVWVAQPQSKQAAAASKPEGNGSDTAASSSEASSFSSVLQASIAAARDRVERPVATSGHWNESAGRGR
eukprot:TRINITY_DN40008_c0_g1_i3.p1 TRINITY_DN40008_c0_g1~~TRINITY_DN40008_c0_g1_i3.p1  ORF type:complete len:198 (-),score=16.63 TRINITY_DN40008_c0_g1_i3:98-691(-)